MPHDASPRLRRILRVALSHCVLNGISMTHIGLKPFTIKRHALSKNEY